MHITLLHVALPLLVILPSIAGLHQHPLSHIPSSHVDHNTVWVLLLGLTGSGKSSFIKDATGNHKVRICHTLDSCTADVEYFSADITTRNGVRQFALIDTPGFDDSKKDDVQVLEEIANGLAILYQQGIKLSAVVYLHRISDNKVAGSAVRSLKVLKEILGPNACDITWLTTSHWSETSLEKGIEREEQLKGDGDKWGSLISQGAKTFRLQDTHTLIAARNLLRQISNDSPYPRALAIQEEMVDQEVPFLWTSAALALDGYMYVESILQGLKKGQISKGELSGKLLDWVKTKVRNGFKATEGRPAEERRSASKRIIEALIDGVETAIRILMPSVVSDVLSLGVDALGWVFSFF